jgi:hypothetical protein
MAHEYRPGWEMYQVVERAIGERLAINPLGPLANQTSQSPVPTSAFDSERTFLDLDQSRTAAFHKIAGGEPMLRRPRS